MKETKLLVWPKHCLKVAQKDRNFVLNASCVQRTYICMHIIMK